MRTPELAAAFFLCLAASAPAAAQYKWVGPGGQVTYSDQPPPAGTIGVALGTPAPTARRDEAALPAALRAASSKYPVTLYTTKDCTPCQQARAHLSRRGIPFSERTVTTRADAELYKQVGFTDFSFPGLTVGRDRSVGFEAGDWDGLLDAAGYPKTSALPPGYRPTPASSLAQASASREAARSNDAGGVVESVAEGTTRDAPGSRPLLPAPRAATEPSRNATTLRF